MKKGILILLIVFMLVVVLTSCQGDRFVESNLYIENELTKSLLPPNPNKLIVFDEDNLSEIYLAGGCFWGVEAYMERVPGVFDVTVGYANGSINFPNPSYEDVSVRETGYVETVHIRYDSNIIDINSLLNYYFNTIDPTTLHRQGNDVGSQYRTGIYYIDSSEKEIINQFIKEKQVEYDKPIVVEVLPLITYYLAEDYHQDYLYKNPNGYCHVDFTTLQSSVKVNPALYPKPSDEYLKETLTDEQYKVTQLADTEKAFTNEYWLTTTAGLYVDITTGEPLFSSKDKFDSGCGWPSFSRPIVPEVVTYVEDAGYGLIRTEVRSRSGNAHLGHLFNDGPSKLGGLRYCINSVSLEFIPIGDMVDRGYGYLISLVEKR
ncbi:MAG: peptide-methionine (R)-S-oxide reductase MsrB [Clostridiales bacterium]|nr:peptide-methionine (R)-S-oxide reductase MsrB [Clostridiales bacterium]